MADGENWDTRNLLFVYGSLLLPTGEAGVDETLAVSSLSLGVGYIHGRLYDLGGYPGAKPVPPDAPGGSERVWGKLLALIHPDTVFAALDRFEGYDYQSPLTSEFIRSTTTVILPDANRTVQSQVYFYNLPIAEKPCIPSGDYLAFKYSKETDR